MPQGQFYPGQVLNEAPIVTDAVVTYNAGMVSNTSAVTTPSVPGSGTAATNTTGINCFVYMRGGTVSAVTINGTTVATTSNATFFVPAGDTISATYTGAPSWFWQPM